MSLPTPLEMMGAPGSPYTRKMRALLRYRGLPYRMIGGDQRAMASRPQPKVRLLPTFYLPDASGEIVAVTDSTPLIRRFDSRLPAVRYTVIVDSAYFLIAPRPAYFTRAADGLSVTD